MEVADIVRAHGEAFVASRGGKIPTEQRRIMRDITVCRTAALGGHVEQCDRCGHRVIAYNSCRNRHCPKCHASAGAEWVADRERDLLPVEYFHVVFTVPEEVAVIALQNKKVVYEILFRTAAETLRRIAADPKHLGAEIGLLAVLHTWGQNLRHHPHVHCIVPGGGPAPDGTSWVPCRPGFFLPVKVLSRLFRGKFLHRLKAAHAEGKLTFHGRVEALRNPESFRVYLAPLYRREWVVYAKPPFGSPAQVLKYLGRYTHRVAISNRRLIGMKDGNVSFVWKDYAAGCRQRVMTISAVEFLRRFLLHVLPKGFVRIRYYGFMANRCRKEKIALCRQLLAPQPASESDVIDEDRGPQTTSGASPQKCPACREGTLVCILTFEAGRSPPILRPASLAA
jgi:hypothetical protein